MDYKVPPSNVELIEDIVKLCRKGLSHDALTLAQRQWGPIAEWDSEEKKLVAIRIYNQLGADRTADAMLLKLWRHNKTNLKIIGSMFYYTLNKRGAILAKEFLTEYEDFYKTPEDIQLLKVAQSILQTYFKNYSEAEKLLAEALVYDPDDAWTLTKKVKLMRLQHQDDEAENLAKKIFAESPTPLTLNCLTESLLRTRGIEAAIDAYKNNVEQFQSAYLWYRYADLCADNHQWSDCEKAIERFEQVRVDKDKEFDEIITNYKAQIAIDKNQYQKAAELLSDKKKGYWRTVRKNILAAKEDTERKVLPVPFMSQQTMTCAPTTIAAIAKYWGYDYSDKSIADEICYDGTTDTKERQWFRDNNFVYREFNLNLDLAFKLIETDIPYTLCTSNGFSSHMQAVIGFNKAVGTLYIMDPSCEFMREMLAKETIEVEAYSGPRCLVFVPENKAHLLDQFDWWENEIFQLVDQFRQAQLANDIEHATEIKATLEQKFPDHLLTLRVQRDLYISNNDDAGILKINGELLKKAPDEGFLLNSSFFCLRDLGRRSEGIENLKTYLDKHNNLDLTITLFNQISDSTDYESLTLELFNKLKRYGSRSASANQAIANYYWGKNNYEKAVEHYLYAHCLDETNDSHAVNFFKASRYIKRQDEALDFLKERNDKYMVRSPQPAITLFQAYELLDQEHIGFEYLMDALKAHPKDSELLNYLAYELIRFGMLDELKAIDDSLKNGLSSYDYDQIQAKRFLAEGEIQQAMEIYKEAFLASPFIEKKASNYFHTLNVLRDQNTVDETISALYEKHPNNSQVLEYVSDWHNDHVFQEKVLTKYVKNRPDYSYIRRRLINVRLDLGLFGAALECARETSELLGDELSNHTILAKCYLRQGLNDKAKQSARHVLTLDVEDDDAFSILMDACQSKEEKISELSFIEEQMKAQTILGIAITNYWFYAKPVLAHNYLSGFINFIQEEYDHLWQCYTVSAYYYIQIGDLETAIKHLLTGAKKFPFTPRMHYELGKTYMLLNDDNNAESGFRAALAINNKWSTVTKELSNLLVRNGQYEQAIAVIQNNLKRSNEDAALYGYLADIHVKMRSDELALDALTLAVTHMSDYRWAWNTLKDVSKRLKKPEYPLQLAKELSNKKPYSAQAWVNLAQVTLTYEDKLSYLDKALECNTMLVKAYSDKIHLFIDNGHYDQAMHVIETTPWGDNLPRELMFLKAELLQLTGQSREAINTMKGVLFHVSGYEYYWRKLIDWIESIGDKADCIKSCYKQIEINPNDEAALCNVSEKLLEIGGEEHIEFAYKCMEKAYYIHPTDQYNVLTYADQLTQQEHYQKSNEVLLKHLDIEDIAFAKARIIKNLCLLEQHEEALARYKEMLLSGVNNYWSIQTPYYQLIKLIDSGVVLELFNERLDELPVAQAYHWSRAMMSENRYESIIQRLGDITSNTVWIGIVDGILEHWYYAKSQADDSFINAHYERITTNKRLLKSLIDLYYEMDNVDRLIALYDAGVDTSNQPAMVDDMFRTVLLYEKRNEEAHKAVLGGLNKQPDSRIHNLKLWDLYFRAKKSEIISQRELDLINYYELVPTEQYVYKILIAMIALQGNNIIEAKPALIPLLNDCKHCFQSVSDCRIATVAKFDFYSLLVDAIPEVSRLKKVYYVIWAYLKL